MQNAADTSGSAGTHGVRNGRGRSGSRRRSTTIPSATSTNANSVPMLVSSSTQPIGANAADTATNTPVMIVLMCGVLYLGCNRAAHGGSRPSRAIDMKIRAWPSWNTSSTEVIAATAPSARMPAAQSAWMYCSATASGSGTLSRSQGMSPVRTSAMATYSTVQTMSDAMMPRGTSRCGFFASSDAVLTASNPMYEKKMIAAPTLIPLRPFGAKLGVVHSAGLMYLSPTMRNSAMIPTLMATITVLTRADSLVPMTSSQVMIPTIASAGRVNTMGIGPTCGAAASSAGSPRAVRRSATSQRGMSTPRPRSSESKDPAQPMATAMLPTPSSRTRSHPMIHATSSPRVA